MSRAKFNSLEISMMEEYGFECGEMAAMRRKFKRSHRMMVRRMTDPNDKDYPNYGLRFNEIFDFRKYEDFYVDYFPLFCKRVYEKGCMNLTIERKNNDISYLRGNIDFATRREQALNTRMVKCIAAIDPSGRLYIHKGIADFARLMDFSPWRIIDYLNPERRGNPRHNWKFMWLSHERHEEITQLRQRILNVLRKHDIDLMHKIAEDINEIEVGDDVYEALADFKLQKILMPNA